MTTPFGYVFPAIRGIQAGREFFTSMCPLRLLPRIFLFNEIELLPELRAQRQLNRGRLPEMALEQRPELADETIAVVVFIDQGLKRCQQMFADLNRYAIRPSRSLGVLYDQRDDRAELVRLVVQKSPLFKGVIEFESSTLSLRSRRLFTLSALYTATAALLNLAEIDESEARAERALSFLSTVADQFPEWDQVRQSKLTAGEMRQVVSQGWWKIRETA